ncbi:unnamed protein product [Strongylus vulgaris]|uniref:Uncharacterized protein n=1 Tax=Strongylus vulgaris TaxID=40348 RepID=A0A3P7J3F9_STRVU|nr:unnamed protein product [Strongylus vulgaris]
MSSCSGMYADVGVCSRSPLNFQSTTGYQGDPEALLFRDRILRAHRANRHKATVLTEYCKSWQPKQVEYKTQCRWSPVISLLLLLSTEEALIQTGVPASYT